MNKAQALLKLAEDALAMTLPVNVRLWDGSVSPHREGPIVVIRRRRALRHILWKPGELGIARAYVQGDIDVEGDLADGLRTVWADVARQRGTDNSSGRLKISPRLALRAIGLALRLGAIGKRPPRPVSESALSGDLHSRERDKAAISHHYDTSNDFYELILDPQMTYSAGYFTETGMSLTDAQTRKLDLICQKLGLKPGMRLLDIGSGWGSLTLHAAANYGVHVTGVTLSAEQRDFVTERADKLGLSDLVDVSLRHFRDLDASGADAVASVEMGEHVGDAEYVDFCNSLWRYLRPGGRALIQQMSRSNGAVGDKPGGGPFIETYIAPDMHMKPLAKTIGLISDAGLEIREVQALREHYPLTVAAWAQNLEEQWDRACALVGEETARVWRLYFAGGALAFEQNRMGVDQILAVKPSITGVSQMPLTPVDWFA